MRKRNMGEKMAEDRRIYRLRFERRLLAVGLIILMIITIIINW